MATPPITVLMNQPPLEHERFAAYRELEALLKANVAVVFGGLANEIALLRKAGATVEPIQAGCCGMAGPFGFEADKFEISKKIAEDGLLPAVERAGPITIIVADGFSCREQIEQLGHREAMHFAEILARSCGYAS